MDKYQLLLILNLPFVIFGLLKAFMAYNKNTVSRLVFIFRLVIWLAILLVLIFAESIYDYLYSHGLTDSTPLSLPDVVLTTGLLLCLSTCIRLYTKNDIQEKRITELHEKLSVELSKD